MVERIRLRRKLATNKSIGKTWADGSTIGGFSLFSFGSGRTSNAELYFLTPTKYFQSTAVMGRRNAISQPAQSPVRCVTF